MSDIIKLLPDSVANQIAAGEVIQRPASVIKELVENAIDAGATSIKIILIDAGRTLIQVVDNGSGMSDTDARLAFERHATSKIRTADDLFSLHTMGFRGEALASIAAIAQVELRTRKKGTEMGTKLCINASVCESQEPDYCAEGSNFMVKNIFFNVPARRKFLKKPATEYSFIIREFEKLALVNHTTEFLLINNDTTMYHLLAGDTFIQRIAALFPRSIEQHLLPISLETTVVKIDGFVCRPENARKRNALQYFFANGRYMKHPYFHKAILSCYEQLIPSDEQPNYFINLTVDPETIDVNIHPTKSEIKFENEQTIWQILFAAVKEALGKFSAIPTIEFDMEGAIDFPISSGKENNKPLQQPTIDVDPNYNPFENRQVYSRMSMPSSTTDFRQDSSRRTISDNQRLDDDNLNNWDKLYDNFERKRLDSLSPIDSSPETDASESADITPDTEAENFVSGTQYLQIQKKYILNPSKNSIMFIDQHRAHIRVLYDRLIASLSTFHIESQRLVFPEIIRLTGSQNVILEALQPQMERMGFDMAFIGDNSWSVNSIPAELKKLDTTAMIEDIIESSVTEGNPLEQKILEQIALSSAKSAAIRYGQILNQSEMDTLVADLFSSREPKYTPDGKLIIHTLAYDEISKMFN